jgi:hypothetical protein
VIHNNDLQAYEDNGTLINSNIGKDLNTRKHSGNSGAHLPKSHKSSI